MDARLIVILAFIGACTGMNTNPASPPGPTDTLATVNTNGNRFPAVGVRDSAATSQPGQQAAPTSQQTANQGPQQQYAPQQQQRYAPQQQQQYAPQQQQQYAPQQQYPPQPPRLTPQQKYMLEQQYLARQQQLGARQGPAPPTGSGPLSTYQGGTAGAATGAGDRGRYAAAPPRFDMQQAKRFYTQISTLRRTGGNDAFERMYKMQGLRMAPNDYLVDRGMRLEKHPSYGWALGQKAANPRGYQTARKYLHQMRFLEQNGSDILLNRAVIQGLRSPDMNIKYMTLIDASQGVYGDRLQRSANAMLLANFAPNLGGVGAAVMAGMA